MAHGSPAAPAPARTRLALDALNFSLADVRDGLGPYLAVYLLTVQHWDEERIGVVMSMADAVYLLLPGPRWLYILLFAGVCLYMQVFLQYTRYVAVLKWLTL